MKPRQIFELLAEDLFYFNNILIPFAFVLALFTNTLRQPLILLLLLAVLPYHLFLRFFVPKFMPFLVLTWLSCGAALLMPHPVLSFLFIALLCSHTVKMRTNTEDRLTITFERLCFPLIFLTVLYFSAEYLHIGFMCGFFHAQAMCVLLLAMLYIHLSGINRELEFASANSLQSTKQITGFVNKYLAVYFIGFFIVLGCFHLMPFGRIAAVLGRAITTVIRFIISLFTLKKGDIEFANKYMAPEEQIDLDVPPMPLWMQKLEMMSVYVVNIIVLMFLILLAVLFFLRLYHGFYRTKNTRLHFLDETSEVTALRPAPRKRKNKVPNDPTRKKFYKKVNKHFKKHRLLFSDTPAEIKTKLEGKEDISELVAPYEKARYGN